MRLLLLGATGLVGSSALKLALSNDAFSEVIAPTRQPLPPNAKLVNAVMPRIEEFASALKPGNVDAVVCALGTTRAKAGSQQAFRHVDYELPIAFGRAAHGSGVGTYAIVTAMGASADSMIFYSRTKGEVERDIRKIGFKSLTICRPGLIGGERNEARLVEKVALTLTRYLAPVLPRKLQVNPASAIAAALLDAVIEQKIGCHWINAEQMTGDRQQPA